MSGSLLGRGRGGRLIVYGGCPLLIFILVFLYHAATSEMDRLRELQEQCVHQQEALAAQLQVIFEYKVRLEKSLAEEKSSNAAIKQELQQRATREKSLRDKDSVEAMQRFNSLQQTYKILQSEHEDLKEECKKREKLALDETTRLETTLQDLRGQLRQFQKDKEKAMENLKNTYMALVVDHEKLEKKYNATAKSNTDNEMTILHFKKEIFQLQREVKELRDGKSNFAKSTPSSEAVLRASPSSASRKPDSVPIPAPQQHQQQVSPPLPPLLHASREYRADGQAALSDEKVNNDANEPANNIGFIQKNGNIVPAGLNEVKEGELLRDAQHKQQREAERLEEEQRKQVMSPPLNRDDDDLKNDYAPAAQAEHPLTPSAIEKAPASSLIKERAENDELQNLQKKINGILFHKDRNVARDFVSSRKADNVSVASNANSLVSPSLVDKVAPPPIKPLKVKLPVGVLPIPDIIEQRVDNTDEEKRQEEIRKRNDAVHNVPPPPRFAPAKNSKEEKEPIVEAGNLDPPFVANPPAAMRHIGEQIERRANDAWLRPGVQEIGEELNQLGRLPGLDDGQANGADDQYDAADYDKEPPQKNDIHLEGEDEGEDDDMLDYPHNLKQEKRE